MYASFIPLSQGIHLDLELVLQLLALPQSLKLADRIIQTQDYLWVSLRGIPHPDANSPVFNLLGSKN